MQFDFDCPDEVALEKKFTVSINFDSEEIYDVKIFAHESEDEKIERSEYLSEIDYNGWKDSWFYLKSAFPEKKKYPLRVLRGSGKNQLCVRLRPSGSDSFETLCKEIEITSEKEEKETVKTEQEEIPISQPVQQIQEPEEKLVLNSPKQETKVFVTPSQTKRNLIICFFIFLCVSITILFALKRL